MPEGDGEMTLVALALLLVERVEVLERVLLGEDVADTEDVCVGLDVPLEEGVPV